MERQGSRSVRGRPQSKVHLCLSRGKGAGSWQHLLKMEGKEGCTVLPVSLAPCPRPRQGLLFSMLTHLTPHRTWVLYHMVLVVAVEPLEPQWISTADSEPHTELDFTGDPISSNGLFHTSAQKEKSQVSLWAFLPGNQFLGDAKPSVNIMGLSTDL